MMSVKPDLSPLSIESGAEVTMKLVHLLAGFRDLGIPYTYWKSSRKVPDVLAALSDLDLLVSRNARTETFALLSSMGCKEVSSGIGKNHPATVSFLAYDEASGKILHIHLHFWIVLGPSVLKAHRLPQESALISRSREHSSAAIRVLDPVDEALLLLIRSCFETRRSDLGFQIHRRAIERKFVHDFAEVSPQVDATQLEERAKSMFSPSIVRLLINRFSSAERLNWRASDRRALAQELEPYARFGPVEGYVRQWAATATYGAAYLNRRFFRLARLPRRLPIGGGAVVAIIGVDGSGKSTTKSALCEWLQEEVDVLPLYFGTGQGSPSFILWPFKKLVPLVSQFIRVKPRRASHGVISDREPGPIYSFLFMIWAAVVALEKRQKITLARRAASRGFLVLADRYPQMQTTEYNDGPLLDRVPNAPAWLRRFEARAYHLAWRSPPDLVIKLAIAPESAATREPAMAPDVLRRRVAVLESLAFQGSRVVTVDAEQPLGEMLKAIRKEVWDTV